MDWLGIDIGGSSVKGARMRDGAVAATAQSERYENPEPGAIRAAIAGVVERIAGGVPSALGVCAPGIYDQEHGRIVRSVNLAGLCALSLRDELAAMTGAGAIGVFTDAHAAAYDFAMSRGLGGRLVAISIGTGVGAAVLDDGVPLLVSGRSPGHLGQIDVGEHLGPGFESVPLGPDGGRGGLEGYIGLPAIIRAYGRHVEHVLSTFTIEHPPVRALVRAIRIVHAIYRPEHVALLGGIGVALRRLVPEIRARVNDELTSLARLGWELHAGDDLLHAARGAARLAEKV
ncbi:MAG: ROK family protein [Phycisphaerae bacterium]|nr:ROK family protein [Phycisphaerae bacterium]